MPGVASSTRHLINNYFPTRPPHWHPASTTLSPPSSAPPPLKLCWWITKAWVTMLENCAFVIIVGQRSTLFLPLLSRFLSDARLQLYCCVCARDKRVIYSLWVIFDQKVQRLGQLILMLASSRAQIGFQWGCRLGMKTTQTLALFTRCHVFVTSSRT